MKLVFSQLSITRHLLLICLLIICYQVLVTNVGAHVLVTNSKIGAVMHIDPEDDPIIGQPANFFFDFKDPDNKFNVNNCHCQFTIKKGDQTVVNGVLQPLGNDQSSATFSYTFTDKGDYTVSIDGDPLHAGDFDEFGLNYPISVNRQAQLASAPTNNGPNNLPLILTAIGVLALFTGLFIFKKFSHE